MCSSRLRSVSMRGSSGVVGWGPSSVTEPNPNRKTPTAPLTRLTRTCGAGRPALGAAGRPGGEVLRPGGLGMNRSPRPFPMLLEGALPVGGGDLDLAPEGPPEHLGAPVAGGQEEAPGADDGDLVGGVGVGREPAGRAHLEVGDAGALEGGPVQAHPGTAPAGNVSAPILAMAS